MISLKNKSKGFTIVELLIVIVVIGILATLVIVTFSGIQQKARNSQRETDVNALTSHIEAYYAQTGNYPTYAQVHDGTWRSTNMKGLDPEALKDPKGNDLAHASTGAVAGTYGYNYYPSHSTDGTECTSADVNTDDTQCDTFVLTAAQEGTTTLLSKKSN